MRLTKKEIKSKTLDGVFCHKFNSWNDFNNFFCDNLLNQDQYIWRGHASEKWNLVSTLDRLIDEKDIDICRGMIIHKQLENFKKAVLGRRGTNPRDLSFFEWFALGQHYGLATPLLDWTSSPYVAAFFAFQELTGKEGDQKKVIWGLNQNRIKEKKGLNVIEPMLDENIRLINQKGVFTYTDDNIINIEKWVINNFENVNNVVLIKFIFELDRHKTVLSALNRMNINHLTLFPDISGSALYCNMDLLINKY